MTHTQFDPRERDVAAVIRDHLTVRADAPTGAPDLAAGSIARAHRIRARRRASGGVAVLALLVAAAVPLLGRQPEPVPPIPAQTSAATPEPTTQAADLRALPIGELPSVGWFVRPDAPAGSSAPTLVHLPNGAQVPIEGFLGGLLYGPRAVLARVPASRETARIATFGTLPSGVAGTSSVPPNATMPYGTSSSGRIAYWYPTDIGIGIVQEHRTSDGRVTTKAAIPRGGVLESYQVRGQLAPGVVLLVRSTNDSPRGGAWRTDPDGRVEAIPGVIDITAASPAADLYAGVPGPDSATQLTQVRQGSDDKVLWQTSDHVLGFSPDGRFAAIGGELTSAGGLVFKGLVDARTGQPADRAQRWWGVAGMTAWQVNHVVFEADGSLLLTASDTAQRSGIVRCRVEATCELATFLIPSRGDSNPYGLLSN